MATSIFGDKKVLPDNDTLTEALAENKAVWDELLAHIEETYPTIGKEWKCYTKAHGWTYVIKSKKRTLLYLTPLYGYFTASFTLGERAAGEVQKADSPVAVKEAFASAQVYMEGRSAAMDIRNEEDLKVAEKLIQIKNDN